VQADLSKDIQNETPEKEQTRKPDQLKSNQRQHSEDFKLKNGVAVIESAPLNKSM